MRKKLYENKEQIGDLWTLIDTLARRMWENDQLTLLQKKQINDAAAEFYGTIVKSSGILPSRPSQSVPAPPLGVDIDTRKDNFGLFSYDVMVDLLFRSGVHTIAEAYLKFLPVLDVVAQNSGRGFAFRGHRNISWEIVPRLGRRLSENKSWKPPIQIDGALELEIDALIQFQKQWDDMPEVDDIDRKHQVDSDSPEWWFRMQHYDRGDGTRLLDVTTSMNAAILFACIDWNTGHVDDAQDGVLYAWPIGLNIEYMDYHIDQLKGSLKDYFHRDGDRPMFIINPPHNERSKAQYGGFLWWPEFWERPPTQAPYYLRVPKESKRDLVTSLLKMGFGPKDVVRGPKGMENEEALKSQLGIVDPQPL